MSPDVHFVLFSGGGMQTIGMGPLAMTRQRNNNNSAGGFHYGPYDYDCAFSTNWFGKTCAM